MFFFSSFFPEDKHIFKDGDKNYIDLLYLLKVDCKRQGGAMEIVLAS